MALDPVINFGIVEVSTGYDAAATAIVLASGDGAKLPSTFSYNLTWYNSTDYANPADDPNVEIVRVTNRVTDTLTVTRAQEGTSATTKNTGSKTYKMILSITKKMIDDIYAEANPDYIRLHDLKSISTDGGTFTQDAWQKRTVTEDQDTGNNCSVTSSVIVLAAGTYDCLISVPAFDVWLHQTRLYNTSDTSLISLGTVGASNTVNPSMNRSFIQDRFIIGASKNIEIQHYCTTTRTGQGFGQAGGITSELYTVAEFKKVG